MVSSDTHQGGRSQTLMSKGFLKAICIVVCVGSSKSDFLSNQVLWSRV